MDIRRSGESPNNSEDTSTNNGQQNESNSNSKGSGGSGLMGPMFAILALIVLVVGGIYLLRGSDTGMTDETDAGPVARVGGETIDGQQFRQQLSNLREATSSRVQQFQSFSETRQQEIILSSFINQELLRQAATNNGVSVSDSEVDSRLQSQIEQIGGEAELESRLEENNLTREEVRENERERILLNRYLAQNVSTTTDAEVQETYDQLSDQRLQLLGQAVNQGSATSTQGTPTLADVRPILEQQLTAQKQQQARQQLLQQARQSINVEVLLDGVSYPPSQQATSQQQPAGAATQTQQSTTSTGSAADTQPSTETTGDSENANTPNNATGSPAE